MELAAIRTAQERHQDAVELLRQSVEEKASAVGNDAPELARELCDLARALWRSGSRAAAVETIERAGCHGGPWLLYRGQWEEAAAALRTEARDAGDPALWEELAEAEEARSDLTAAREAWDQAAAEWTRTVAAGHPRVVTCRRRADRLSARVA